MSREVLVPTPEWPAIMQEVVGDTVRWRTRLGRNDFHNSYAISGHEPEGALAKICAEYRRHLEALVEQELAARRTRSDLPPLTLREAAELLLKTGRRADSGRCRYCNHEMYEGGILEDTHDERCPLLALARALEGKVEAEYVHGVSEMVD